MNDSLVPALLLASGVETLRKELVRKLEPVVGQLMETVVQFVLSSPSPAAAMAFERQLQQQARELNRQAVAWAYNRPEADGPESLPHDALKHERVALTRGPVASARVRRPQRDPSKDVA